MASSPWRYANGGPPKSPFRPQNQNDKTFQLNFADSEANRTFIPMTDVSYREDFILSQHHHFLFQDTHQHHHQLHHTLPQQCREQLLGKVHQSKQ